MNDDATPTTTPPTPDPTDPLAALEAAVARAVEIVGPSTVTIGRRGRGSGVVVAADRVLTNAHNLRDRTTQVTFAGGRAEQGEVVGLDPDGDLVVLAVPTGDAPVAAWADTAPDATPAAVGSVVTALARGTSGLRVSTGVVAASDRSFRGPGGRLVTDGLEHTAPLAPGSTGGPLVNRHGRVVGITTLRPHDGFAVARPASAGVRTAVERLAGGGTTARPNLGVAVAPPEVAARLRAAVGLDERQGLLVRDVEDDSAAAAAGVRAGDLLVRADGEDLTDVDVLHRVLAGHTAGDGLTLGVVRGAEELELAVTLT
ncbi:MAG: S1C family serine protease [Microthrixaceae bacterium]